jgi:hypothetical protein
MQVTDTPSKKPTSFLDLPRELRDEIYTQALQMPVPIDIGCCLPSPGYWHDPVSNPLRPSTPHLLLANKQIHDEATAVLYGTNTFKFPHPGQFSAFNEQIGADNAKQIKNISLWIRFPGPDEIVFDAGDMLPEEYDSVPEHWMAVLHECRMTRVRHLAIEAEMIGCEPEKVLSVLPMPDELRDFIVEFLGRGEGEEGGGVPRLSLKGIREEEREKFPEGWDVWVSQWN